MLNYSVTFEDADAVTKLRSILVQDYTQPLRKSVVYMEQITKQRFIGEVDPDGVAWAKLKPSTILRKKSGSILRETGVLSNSISSRVVGDTGIIETSVFYGIFHQTGTRFMAKRQFLGFGQSDIRKINQFFQQHLNNVL